MLLTNMAINTDIPIPDAMRCAVDNIEVPSGRIEDSSVIKVNDKMGVFTNPRPKPCKKTAKIMCIAVALGANSANDHVENAIPSIPKMIRYFGL